jgi:hypothetical protein
MAVCHSCGNDYDKAFEIRKDGRSYAFDSFECAIATLAPTCPHCEARIIGHGVEAGGETFCCAHCAAWEGETRLRDRA